MHAAHIFDQVLRELLAHGGLVGSDLIEKSQSASPLRAYLQMPLTFRTAPAASAPLNAASEPKGRR